MGVQGVSKPPADFFWTLGGWSLFSSNPTHAPFGPETGSGTMQSLSLQFSWPTGVDSSLDFETCSLTLLLSRQNEEMCLFCGVNDRNRNVTGVASRCCTHTHKHSVWVFAGSFSYFLKALFNWAELLHCAWNSFVIVAFPLPSSPVLFFFQIVCVFALEPDGSSGGWNDGCRSFRRISAN